MSEWIGGGVIAAFLTSAATFAAVAVNLYKIADYRRQRELKEESERTALFVRLDHIEEGVREQRQNCTAKVTAVYSRLNGLDQSVSYLRGHIGKGSP